MFYNHYGLTKSPFNYTANFLAIKVKKSKSSRHNSSIKYKGYTMGDYDYGRENGLWGEDGIPYGIDDHEPSYRSQNRSTNNDNEGEVVSYVELMKEFDITTIVAMNNYITEHQLWGMFSRIKRENTFASGFTSMGISKEAYKAIMDLYRTDDVITSHLVSQNRV